ncbi:MAG TPA: dipeptide epimerase [Bacteroidetes bacterium]|nr:dipeptide epimerase [Bacteroidota bacterium]
MKFSIYPITLYLKEAFTISRDSYSERRAVIVELEAAGHKGYGEASEHSYYGIDRAAMLEQARAIGPVIENYSFDNPANFWHYMAPHVRNNPFLQCAIDNAAHDLHGRICRQPCHRQWGLEAAGLIKTSYTLSIAPVEKMIEKIRSTGFDIYKIKLGTPDDMDILRQLRQHTDAIFRIDANCAWTAEQTIRYSHIMKDLGVEFIEQPLPADDWEGMEKVYEKSALPVIADEACPGENMVARCAKYFHGINIKLMKCGGLTPALRMIRQAKELGLKVMMGCMVESSVGISAIAQVLPLLDYVDMDGALLLADDPATGATVLPDGSVVLPGGDGLGIVMK